MIRNPVVAGQFYPADPRQLKVTISRMTDEKAAKENAMGILIPHAGYVYSGAVVGAVLSRVKLPETVIIMGPNHTGMGKPFSIMSEGTWKTPLGDVEIDSELAKKILSASTHLEEDFEAHRFEHAVEVQLPFLQYFKPDIKFVPIIFGSTNGKACKQIGKELTTVIKTSDREVLLIVSSDMNHYESQERTNKKDKRAIEAILELNEDKLLNRIDEQDISMCGYAPAASLISAVKEMGDCKAELVKYQTSGDTSGEYSAVVGYAGIIIKKKE